MFYKVNDNNEIMEICIENYDGKFLETDKNIIESFDGRLIFENETQTPEYLARKKAFEEKQKLNKLRLKRENECFTVVNQNFIIDGKSVTWFDTLTEDQKTEASAWVQAWRDVTDTLVVPDKPSWLR